MSLQVALSIQQPWAWAILKAGKDIENREWFSHYRGRFLIHAGKRYDKEGHCWIEEQFQIKIPPNLPVGGIVGSVRLVDIVDMRKHQCKSKWFFGRFGFVLSEPQEMNFIPYRGKLGFFQVAI